MLGPRRSACALLGLATALLAPPAAHAADARFPDPAPPTQISRDLSLQQAAQRGMVTLTGKNGPFAQGDNVSVKLTPKQTPGPITVTVRVEFSLTARVTRQRQEQARSRLPRLRDKIQAVLNRGAYRTRQGDPIVFQLDFQFRAPDAPERQGYHQVRIITRKLDLDPPDPDFRSGADMGIPNRLGATQEGRWTLSDFADPATLAHETLHLVGLDDRYDDFYRVGGRDYPLPFKGMREQQLAEFARDHRPPLPPPPTGRMITLDQPGTGRCDFMGSGSTLPCRRISRRDLDWIESQAGVQVAAEPGDLLLNKDSSQQNFGIGFRTIVFAAPGETTTAEGISTFCIDEDLTLPGRVGFDVLGPARAVPGYEPLARLLELSGTLQPSLERPVSGLLYAIWHVTDALEVDATPDPSETRMLLGQAGVAEGSVPGGLPHLSDPNAGAPATAAVTSTGVLPPLTTSTARRPPARINLARLYPARLPARRRARADLLLSSTGDVKHARLVLQRRAGRRWRRVRRLHPRKIASGREVLPLTFGRLRGGRYRLTVTVGPRAARQVPLRVRRG